jgi:hypothetical protein
MHLAGTLQIEWIAPCDTYIPATMTPITNDASGEEESNESESAVLNTVDIECRRVIADNCFKLYQSDLPFVYLPEYMSDSAYSGQFYWVCQFGFKTDSPEFQALANGQVVTLDCTDFGIKTAYMKINNT